MNPLQNNDSFEQWSEDGAKSAETVGNEAARKMLDRFAAPPLDDAVAEALAGYVAGKRARYA